VRGVWCAALVLAATACDKEIVVGADPIGDAGAIRDGSETKDAMASDASGAGEEGGLTPLTVPWTTGFENGFTDWSQPSNEGFCYVMGDATFGVVTSPVHSGQYAAFFTVNTSAASPSQTRCIRQGVLPTSAYYGAWYYVPAPATGTWNLFHFQGADSPDAGATQSLWDLSLVSETDGGITPFVYDFARAQSHITGPVIPIGTWFHLEVRFTRSTTANGEFAAYMNGQVLVDLTGIETDVTRWGQWYVGNYATSLVPSPSTVYVDDVTIDMSGP
jgi:hypothetical protein